MLAQFVGWSGDPNVLVYLGPNQSGFARAAIPILCRAQLGMISHSATYPGLTRQTPYNAPGEPEVYYPNCQRNFARVLPTDDMQGAAATRFAMQLGITRVHVIDDGSVYGQNLAAVFSQTATKLGLQVVGGPESFDMAASDYHSLADRIRQANPGAVYYAGDEGGHVSKCSAPSRRQSFLLSKSRNGPAGVDR